MSNQTGKSPDPLEFLNYALTYAEGFDAEGCTGICSPYSWETAARVSFDMIRAAIAQLRQPTDQPRFTVAMIDSALQTFSGDLSLIGDGVARQRIRAVMEYAIDSQKKPPKGAAMTGPTSEQQSHIKGLRLILGSIAIRVRNDGEMVTCCRKIDEILAALRQPVDLEQFRVAVECWQFTLAAATASQSWLLNDPDHIADVAKAKRLLALIDSQKVTQ